MTQGELQPQFIEGSAGALFALHHKPASGIAPLGCVLVVPSFAEEMNRCRYMQTLLAQAISPAGWGMLVVDPHGTGDSAGDFKDFTWSQWVDDTLTAVNYAKSLGYEHIVMLGIRLGATLAQEVATNTSVQQLVFWQPVVSGKVTLNQFLRLKIAASMARDETATTTAALEQTLAQGECIQVAGYDISPGLYDGMKLAHLNNHMQGLSTPVDWFTVLASEERSTPRGDSNAIAKWQACGTQVRHHEIIGPAFWQAHERTLAPALVAATADLLLRGTT